MLKIVQSGSADFEEKLSALETRGEADLLRVEPAVREIIRNTRERGDAALIDYALQFDGSAPEEILLSNWREQARTAPDSLRGPLQEAADRIRSFHMRQLEGGFSYEADGITLGHRVRPVRRAGVYAPGGKARYPSTVLMTAVVAQVAGVEQIILATPRPTLELLVAAEVSGVTDVVDAGGAQAIAALAYGTESVPAVDCVVGPGNIYVACAKRLVYGTVNIDQIAGPSEILVVADDDANPSFAAADLLSQAEHDEDAYPLLITVSRAQADAIGAEVERQLANLPRKAIAKTSLERNGWCFVASSLEEAAKIADRLASEHLSLQVRKPEAMADDIRAGAIFLGDQTPEAAGDYAAGPSHVLPTGGAARFGSPLGVHDFLVRTSMIRYTRQALQAQSNLLTSLSELEGLTAHAEAVRVRTKD